MYVLDKKEKKISLTPAKPSFSNDALVLLKDCSALFNHIPKTCVSGCCKFQRDYRHPTYMWLGALTCPIQVQSCRNIIHLPHLHKPGT